MSKLWDDGGEETPTLGDFLDLAVPRDALVLVFFVSCSAFTSLASSAARFLIDAFRARPDERGAMASCSGPRIGDCPCVGEGVWAGSFPLLWSEVARSYSDVMADREPHSARGCRRNPKWHCQSGADQH